MTDDPQAAGPDAWPRIAARTTCGIAWVAALFSFAVCVLLIAHYVHARTAPPLENPAVQKLLDQARGRPAAQELREAVRALDLTARHAFFTNQRQIRTGAGLLLTGVAVLLAALHANAALRRRTPNPIRSGPSESSVKPAGLAKYAVAATGAVLLATALLLAAHSSYKLDDTVAESDKRPSRSSPGIGQARPEVRDKPTTPDPRPDTPAWLDIGRHWPTFRGPGGNGIATYTNTPTLWNVDTGQGIRWSAAVPRPGFSSPIVWDKRLFVTGADAEAREVFCYHAETGELLWRTLIDHVPGSPAELPEVIEDVGYAAPTPATDGRHVFAIFGNGDLVCLDMDGKRVWAHYLGRPDNPYGHASSLMIYRNLLIVQYDHRTAAAVTAFESKTGRQVWKTERLDVTWSSPLCVNTGTRTELILTASPWVDAYDPATGSRLWGLECLGSEVGPSAAYANGMVFVANDNAQAAGIRLTPDGESPARIAWTWDDLLPDVASPLATDRFVFLATSGGTIACLQAETGALLWEQEFDKGFSASPILSGTRVYALDIDGVMHIFEAAETFTSLGDLPLGEAAVCTPAIMDGCLYLRSMTRLFCIGTPSIR